MTVSAQRCSAGTPNPADFGLSVLESSANNSFHSSRAALQNTIKKRGNRKEKKSKDALKEAK